MGNIRLHGVGDTRKNRGALTPGNSIWSGKKSLSKQEFHYVDGNKDLQKKHSALLGT